MHRRSRLTPLVLFVLFALLAPRPAAAQGAVAHQRVVGLLNPMGAEHALAVGLRAPLGLPDELLTADTHLELGAVSYTSPIYQRTGGYLELQPLAILILRAELRQVAMWSIDLPGAGYVPVEANDARGAAGSATGWEAQVTATVQGMVPLGELRLLMWSQLGYERIALGGADRYVSPRHDAVLAREDGVLASSSMLLLEIPLLPDLRLRAGAYDELSFLPRSEALTNQVGPIVALTVERPAPGLAELTPLVRAGIYTDGRRAAELTVLLGLLLEYR